MKKAFISGLAIYNSNTIGNLPGVENDVKLMHNLLGNLGFQINQFIINEFATKKSLISALEAFVNSSEIGDYLIWYHSGHGSHRYSPNSGERDNFREIIVTYEIDWNDPLWDSDLVSILDKLHNDAHMLVIIDACNSEGAADEKFMDTPWSVSKFTSPPKEIIEADNKARIADMLKREVQLKIVKGVKNRESVFLSDYTPACVDSELTNKPYVVLTSSKYNQRSKMDYFSVDGNTINMSVFTHALIRDVRNDSNINLGELAWKISKFTQDWGHVSTLTARPEYISAKFNTFSFSAKDISFPGQAFLHISEELQNIKEVKSFIISLENQGVSFIPVQDIRGNLSDFSDIMSGVIILKKNDIIIAHSVLKNGTILSENIINYQPNTI